MLLHKLVLALALAVGADVPPTASPDDSALQIPEITLQSLHSIIRHAADIHLCDGTTQCSVRCTIVSKADDQRGSLVVSVNGPYVRLQALDEEVVFAFNADTPKKLIVADAKNSTEVVKVTDLMFRLFVLEVGLADVCLSQAVEERNAPSFVFDPKSI